MTSQGALILYQSNMTCIRLVSAILGISDVGEREQGTFLAAFLVIVSIINFSPIAETSDFNTSVFKYILFSSNLYAFLSVF